jgi:hypothetical protein
MSSEKKQEKDEGKAETRAQKIAASPWAKEEYKRFLRLGLTPFLAAAGTLAAHDRNWAGCDEVSPPNFDECEQLAKLLRVEAQGLALYGADVAVFKGEKILRVEHRRARAETLHQAWNALAGVAGAMACDKQREWSWVEYVEFIGGTEKAWTAMGRVWREDVDEKGERVGSTLLDCARVQIQVW